MDVFSSTDTPGVGGAAFEIATIVFDVIGPPDASTDLFIAVDSIGWVLGGQQVPTDYVPSSVTVTVPELAPGGLLALGLAIVAAGKRRSFEGTQSGR